MDKKTILFVVIAFILVIVMFVFSIILLFRSPETPVETTKNPVVDYEFDDTLTVPTEDVKDQIAEIDKTGFSSQTLYWIEKLKGVLEDDTSLEKIMNDGSALADLCEKYFPDEYKAYKEAVLLGDDKNQEYSAEENSLLYNNLIKMAETGDFYGIISNIESLLSHYKFTLPYNYNIGNIYHDAKIAINLEEMSAGARTRAIAKMKDPAMMFICAVQESPQAQCAMFTSGQTVLFKTGTKINIQNIETYTINAYSENVDDILMNQYFNPNVTDLKVVKITFVINYDLSTYTPDYFHPYFTIEDKKEPILIYDEDGNILYNLTDLTTEELKEWVKEHPEYADKIVINETPENTDPIVDGGSMSKPSEPVVKINQEKYEEFQKTVYEVYMPVYSIRVNTFNKIYMVKQVSNLHMPYLQSKSSFMATATGNQELIQFIRDNEWFYLQVDKDELKDKNEYCP